MEGNIEIRGARVHNLKNISLNIPRNRFIVITGVSGSGNHRLHLILSMQKDREGMLRAFHRMHGNSWAE